MLDLSNVTLLSIIHDTNMEMANRVSRVMNYCMGVMKFRRSILLTHVNPEIPCKAEVVQFPEMVLGIGVQVFIVKMLHLLDTGPHVMHVHEDGFPIDLSMWDNEFLNCDYIGAPWTDAVVGNGGFFMQSRKCIEKSKNLPFMFGCNHADNFMCRDNRKAMEDMGVKFASFELGVKFSVETVGHGHPSFGYHGRTQAVDKHNVGWAIIEAFEAQQK